MFKISVEIKGINSRLTEALFALVAALRAITDGYSFCCAELCQRLKVTKVSKEGIF